VWGSTDLPRWLTDGAAKVLRRALRTPPDHHAPYPDEILSALPLRAMASPTPFIEAAYEAGWTGVRIQRLRDVEWAAMQREPWPLGRLEQRPRYMLIADA
jgi:hypothetical protein